MVRGVWAVSLVLVAASTSANDGWLGQGGSPKAFGKPASVRMKSERISIRVDPGLFVVDCDFEFVNDGPAAFVKMGFPDDDSARAGEEGEDFQPILRDFKSWVAGKAQATKFEKVGMDWFHTKTVRFPAKSTVRVRDRYTVEIGASIGMAENMVNHIGYLVNSGAAWKGPIGRTEIEIRFHPSFPVPKRVEPMATYEKAVARLFDEPDENKMQKGFKAFYATHLHTVFYAGPGKPTIKGRTLRFVKANFEPTQKDNVWLQFNPHQPKK